MKKTSPQNLNPDWSVIGNQAPWSLISSPTVARLLGVHNQTITNWRARNILPAPEPASKRLKGNVVRYRISAIRAWVEGSSEEAVTWAWIKEKLPGHKFEHIGQAKFLVKHCYDLLGVEKPVMTSVN